MSLPSHVYGKSNGDLPGALLAPDRARPGCSVMCHLDANEVGIHGEAM
jgi:hypothetical protein